MHVAVTSDSLAGHFDGFLLNRVRTSRSICLSTVRTFSRFVENNRKLIAVLKRGGVSTSWFLDVSRFKFISIGQSALTFRKYCFSVGLLGFFEVFVSIETIQSFQNVEGVSSSFWIRGRCLIIFYLFLLDTISIYNV